MHHWRTKREQWCSVCTQDQKLMSMVEELGYNLPTSHTGVGHRSSQEDGGGPDGPSSPRSHRSQFYIYVGVYVVIYTCCVSTFWNCETENSVFGFKDYHSGLLLRRGLGNSWTGLSTHQDNFVDLLEETANNSCQKSSPEVLTKGENGKLIAEMEGPFLN